MAISTLLDAPFFTGTPVSSLVPRPYDCAVGGRPYMIDFSFTPFRRDAFRHRSIALLRPQQDTNNVPGENSVNPEGLWRRSQDSFHHGAGQAHLDRKDSDAARFRASKGIDVWTHWQATLLPDTVSRRASSATNLLTTVAGSYFYLCDSSSVVFTQDLTVAPAWTTVSVTGPTASSITSDGFNVWMANAAGVYATTRGAASASQYVTTALAAGAQVAYVKGRLMVASGPSIYNVVAAGALPTALMTQANTDWTWVAFAEGLGQIYAAGFSGDKSLVYRTAVLADGTALAAPVVAGELPKGEVVRAMRGYLGFIVLGTDKGVRFAQANANGDLTIGSLIPTPAGVYCFEGQDRFIWFGWSNYDASSTGLGRLDLTVFTNPLTPAYASDLMVANAAGQVQSVNTFQNMRVFSVSGVGLFATAATKVASGTIDSGLVTYDVSDAKTPVFVDLLFAPLPAGTAVSTALSGDGAAFGAIGTDAATGDSRISFPAPQAQVHTAELRDTLTGSGASSPTLYRHTLRSLVAAVSGTEILVPLILNEKVLVGDREVEQVPSVELAYLDQIRQDRRIITYQEGATSFQVTLESIDFLPEHWGRNKDQLDGVAVVTFHTLT